MEDRRKRKTRKLIRETFLTLYGEHEGKLPGVTELCARADIHRSTFYFYYPDIPALLEQLREDFLTEVSFFTPDQDEGSIRAQIRSCADYIRQNPRSFLLLYEQGMLAGPLTELSLQHLREEGLDDPITALYVSYTVNGSLQAMYWWIRNAPELDTAQIADILFDLTSRIGQAREASVPQVQRSERSAVLLTRRR